MKDKQIEELIKAEKKRQTDGLELIPSENYVSSDVLQALGSVFTNKYSEGYPGRRYYGGQENTDQVEQLAIDRAKNFSKQITLTSSHILERRLMRRFITLGASLATPFWLWIWLTADILHTAPQLLVVPENITSFAMA